MPKNLLFAFKTYPSLSTLFFKAFLKRLYCFLKILAKYCCRKIAALSHVYQISIIWASKNAHDAAGQHFQIPYYIYHHRVMLFETFAMIYDL